MTGQVACMADKDLPASGGCGVFGSNIVFASGHKASDCLPCPDCSTQVYGYDIHDPKQEIVKMEGAFGTLNDGKEQPLVVEFAGKLYVLSLKDFVKGGVSFEVFDPEQGTWSALPMYPYCGLALFVCNSDAKLFMSCRTGCYSAGPIYCFDLAEADHDPEWRRVRSEHSNKKLLFTSHRLPAELPGQPNDCHFFHLRANNVCCVSTWLIEDHDAVMKPGMHTVRGAAIPFQYEFDISKVDTDRKNCFTVRFEHPRIFEYHSGKWLQPQINFTSYWRILYSIGGIGFCIQNGCTSMCTAFITNPVSLVRDHNIKGKLEYWDKCLNMERELVTFLPLSKLLQATGMVAKCSIEELGLEN
ncbi:hypothetical protein ACLB2K_035669 [Fragaria x ananassa]